MPFDKNPETINKKGRPRKGECLTELMREYLHKVPEGLKLERMELFIRKEYELAETGDNNARNHIWNYIDGMPKQSITYEGDPPVSPLAIEIKGLRDDKNTDSGATDVKPKTS